MTLVSQRLVVKQSKIFQKVISGVEGTFEYSARDLTIPDNKLYLGSIAIVPQTKWVVVITQTAEEAHSYIIKLKLIIGFLGFLSIVLATILASAILKKVLKPLNNLIKLTKHISDGAYRIIQQENTYEEIDELCSKFNIMVNSLKNREGELKDSEQRFRTLFEQAAVGVAQIDSKTGRFVRINKRYCEITGYSDLEMKQITFQDITHPEDLQEDLNYMKELISGDIKEFSMAKRYYHKSGEIIWVKLYVSPMWKTETQPDYHIAVVEDITNLKIAESELNHQKELLQTIIDNIPVLITLYDPNVNMMLVNKEFEKVVGWNNDEIKNIDIMKECYPDPDYRDKALMYMQKASTEWHEFTVRTKGGENIESIWSNVRMEGGT